MNWPRSVKCWRAAMAVPSNPLASGFPVNPLVQVKNNGLDGASSRTMKRALAGVVPLHDLLVWAALDVRFMEHQVVQPAARSRTIAGRRSRAIRTQILNCVYQIIAQQNRPFDR